MIGKEESGDLEKIFVVSRWCSDCGLDRQMPAVHLKRMSTDSSQPHFSPFSTFTQYWLKYFLNIFLKGSFTIFLFSVRTRILDSNEVWYS